ncbi:MAG: hypothetical protein ACYTGV_13920 [Planctomycetota bacterium]|jgi:hypothetical protein
MGLKLQVEVLTEGFVLRSFDGSGAEERSMVATNTGDVIKHVNAWVQMAAGRPVPKSLSPTKEE